MNTRFNSTPELIGTCRTVDGDGNDNHLGDKIIGLQVQKNKAESMGLVQLDVRNFNRGTSLIIEVELPELVAALSFATLNADRA